MNQKILSIICISLISLMFVAGSVSANQSPVNLGSAGNFVILSKAGISATGTTSITGNIGTSPIDSTGITGFGLSVDASNEFATSPLVSGKIYAADYASPTPTTMTTAISDMETAYTDAAGRTLPDYTELGAGNIGGMTLTPGLYKWGTDLIIPSDVTISGSSTDVWIFQIAGTLDISSATNVILSGGAQAKNIFWQVAGQTTLGTTSVLYGNILSQTAIVLNTGATLKGRALAQTEVTLDSNSVSMPSGSTTVTITPPVSTNTGGNSNSQPSSSNKDDDESTNLPVITTNSKAIVKINPGVSSTITRDGEVTKISFVDGKTRFNSDDVKVETSLDVEVDNGLVFVTQSNGAKSEVKIMPSTASETAIARLKLKVCTEENNCTIVLKEISVGKETKIVYQVKAQRNVKIIGLFKSKMNVETNIDAETNKIISTKSPWWSFLAKEEK